MDPQVGDLERGDREDLPLHHSSRRITNARAYHGLYGKRRPTFLVVKKEPDCFLPRAPNLVSFILKKKEFIKLLICILILLTTLVIHLPAKNHSL